MSQALSQAPPHVPIHVILVMPLIKKILHFSPNVLDGSTKVQGCYVPESRPRKGRSQDLNPYSLGPVVTPAKTTLPLSSY